LGFTNTTKQIIAFVKTATVFDLDEVIVNKTIELRKKHKIKLPDAIIASTAIIHKLTLITHNVNDFKNIKNLKVQDSFLL